MSDVFVAVKHLISRSGMSAWNVAHKAGCSEATINNWLAGRVTEPHLPTLIKVARIFGKAIELTDGEAQLVDASAIRARDHEFVGYWRRWQ
jgi:DNA-binding XRE family transcriptional regulator